MSDTFSQQIIAHSVFNITSKYQADIYRASGVFQEFDSLHPKSIITLIANKIFQMLRFFLKNVVIRHQLTFGNKKISIHLFVILVIVFKAETFNDRKNLMS